MPWQVELRAVGTGSLQFHSWIEQDDYGQSSFVLADEDPAFTMTRSPAVGYDRGWLLQRDYPNAGHLLL